MKYLTLFALIAATHGSSIEQLHEEKGWPTGKFVPRDNTTMNPNIGNQKSTCIGNRFCHRRYRHRQWSTIWLALQVLALEFQTRQRGKATQCALRVAWQRAIEGVMIHMVNPQSEVDSLFKYPILS